MVKLLIAVNSKDEGNDLCDYFQRCVNIEVVGIEYSGQSAYEKIISLKPDVVLMNMIMPELDGLGVLERLMTNLSVPKLPRVIIISSVDSPRIMECANQLGADYYFTKPYRVEMIYNRILQTQLTIQNAGKRMIRDYGSIQKLESDEVDDVYLETEITNVMRRIGIPAHIKGYQYVRTGIIMAIHDTAILEYVTKLLYPAIAEEYNTSPGSVERAIRHAIGIAWTRGDRKILHDIFGCTIATSKGKPTNSEFIAQIADRYRLNYNIRRHA